MSENKVDKNIAFKEVLKYELIKAMGCTEPIALAYCAALARKTLGKIPTKVYVGASGSIIKNVKSVIVPNTGHMKGIEVSAAVGIIAGDADAELLVVANVNENETAPKIKKYLEETEIKVEPIFYGEIFDIVVKVSDGNDEATVRIAKYHTNVVLIEKNGKILKGMSIEDSMKKDANKVESNVDVIDTYKQMLNIDDIITYAKTCDINDVKSLIGEQIKCNEAIANEGIKNKYGSSIGQKMLKNNFGGEFSKAIAYAAAGSDARMNGCEMGVVINSGSGNQGITVSVPIIIYAKEHNIDSEKMYRALILSNLVSIYQKYPIGTLSAFCGAITASAGAGAGLAYLIGLDDNMIKEVVANTLGMVAGIACDGAKSSCAGKIAMALSAAVLGIEMAKNNDSFKDGDGIIKKTLDETVKGVGRIGRYGMNDTNKEIIDIMIKK